MNESKSDQLLFLPVSATRSQVERIGEKEVTLITGREAAGPTPRLVLPLVIFQQFACYLQSTSKEFQAMGFVEHENGMFIVSELAVPPHWGTTAHAILDQDSFPKFLEQLEASGKDVGNLRLQAHSHGLTSAYFSQEDVDTIREAYTCDWMVSLVGNQMLEMQARLDVFEPITLSVSLPILISVPNNNEQRAEWLKELHANTRSELVRVLKGFRG